MIRKSFIALAIAATMMLSACGAEDKVIDGVKYGTYGIANTEMHNSKIQYEISGWSVFWAIFLSETIVGPVYFIGWDLYQPVALIDPTRLPGQVE